MVEPELIVTCAAVMVFAPPIVSVLLALIVGAIIIACLGKSPIEGYGAMISGALGDAGTAVFLRLSAFILLCMGVQIVWDGASELMLTLWRSLPH